MERLDKLLSLHNICSRRQAAALTRAGQVRLNGVAVRRADIHVDTARDTLEVNGKPLLLQQHLYIMMHKPAGVLSASRDPHGKTVVDSNILRLRQIRTELSHDVLNPARVPL